MNGQSEVAARWEKMSHLISDVLQDDVLFANLQNSTSQAKVDLMKKYGFSDEEMQYVVQDLTKLSGTVMGMGVFWF